jgi:hypothetical protein
MITSIPLLQSALNFYLNTILLVKVVPKYLNCSNLSTEVFISLYFVTSYLHSDLQT